jgi:hypothetical protein
VRKNGALIWSCGGGTQSGAMAVLIAEERLARPDLCVMVDTGRERSGTWPFVDGFIRTQLNRVGLELSVVHAAPSGLVPLFSEGGDILLPGYTTQSGNVGKLPAFCSGTWKRDVQERYLRSIGIETGTQWLGISADEVRRMRSQHRPWLKVHYPLIFDVRLKRVDCVALIRAAGWAGPIPHSACWMCANASDQEWLEMRRDWPEDFSAACELEIEVRLVDPHFWLHPSCVPLGEVEFGVQHSMFSDRGCTEGCFT